MSIVIALENRRIGNPLHPAAVERILLECDKTMQKVSRKAQAELNELTKLKHKAEKSHSTRLLNKARALEIKVQKTLRKRSKVERATLLLMRLIGPSAKQIEARDRLSIL